jgi:AcrR family transcriptional regulator
MGYRHSKDEILEGAISFALAEGLSRMTFGSLARHLGISDRIIVYYFPSKSDLINEVMGQVGLRVQTTLQSVIKTAATDHKEFVGAVWPALAQRKNDPMFALFFEASGLAVAGVEPYRSMAPALVRAWIDWAEQSIDGPPAIRKTQASAAIATLDGLLLMRQLAGAEVANRAAKGIMSPNTRSSRRGK